MNRSDSFAVGLGQGLNTGLELLQKKQDREQRAAERAADEAARLAEGKARLAEAAANRALQLDLHAREATARKQLADDQLAARASDQIALDTRTKEGRGHDTTMQAKALENTNRNADASLAQRQTEAQLNRDVTLRQMDMARRQAKRQARAAAERAGAGREVTQLDPITKDPISVTRTTPYTPGVTPAPAAPDPRQNSIAANYVNSAMGRSLPPSTPMAAPPSTPPEKPTPLDRKATWEKINALEAVAMSQAPMAQATTRQEIARLRRIFAAQTAP